MTKPTLLVVLLCVAPLLAAAQVARWPADATDEILHALQSSADAWPRCGTIAYELRSVHRPRSEASDEELEAQIAERLGQETRALQGIFTPSEIEQKVRGQLLMVLRERVRHASCTVVFDASPGRAARFRLTEQNLIPREELEAKYGRPALNQTDTYADEIVVCDGDRCDVERHLGVGTARYRNRSRSLHPLTALWSNHVSWTQLFSVQELQVVNLTPGAEGRAGYATISFVVPERGRVAVREVIDPTAGYMVLQREIHTPHGTPMRTEEMLDYRLVQGFWIPFEVQVDYFATKGDGESRLTTTQHFVLKQVTFADAIPEETFTIPVTEGVPEHDMSQLGR